MLEVGTGSGFQAAVLAQLVKEVYTIEVHQKLSQQAQKTLDRLGYNNIKYKIGDGKLGWKEFAPFDKIIITAVAQKTPILLIQQLKNDGKVILPLQINFLQYLFLITKSEKGEVMNRQLIPVCFVPLL